MVPSLPKYRQRISINKNPYQEAIDATGATKIIVSFWSEGDVEIVAVKIIRIENIAHVNLSQVVVTHSIILPTELTPKLPAGRLRNCRYNSTI